MERLTYFKDGYWRVNFSGVQYQADFVDRLAAYEDTGLSPEKVSWMKEVVEAAFDNDTSRIERAHNLHVAAKEGRVIVLCRKADPATQEIVKRMRTLVLDHCPEFRGLMAPPCAFMDECPEMEPCKEGQA